MTRLTLLILNLVAAVAFVCLAAVFTSVHRAHAYSTYRCLVVNYAVVEGQSSSDGRRVDILQRLEGIGGVGIYYTLLAGLAAVTCIANGLIIFFRHPRSTRVI